MMRTLLLAAAAAAALAIPAFAPAAAQRSVSSWLPAPSAHAGVGTPGRSWAGGGTWIHVDGGRRAGRWRDRGGRGDWAGRDGWRRDDRDENHDRRWQPGDGDAWGGIAVGGWAADGDWADDAREAPRPPGYRDGWRNPCRAFRWDGWSWRC
jgi:hypothetical protein